MRLYTYFRSSAAYRVRIALALKGLDYDSVPVHLVKDGGQQHQPAYLAINPQGLVPALETDDGALLTQSLAIIEYLDETHPTPPLLPADALGRAQVRAMAQVVACDIHPLNNSGVISRLRREQGLDDAAVTRWMHHWMGRGFTALERLVSPQGAFCHGDSVTLADLYLVPQMYNARRFNLDLTHFPRLVEIDARCRTLPAFQQAAPEKQPDWE
ncbi:maleylacetoacetate isomerase [Niveispirillum sp. SYP-B3756]|uniref:maleylacetoacetate isomerase n=1 Tax=Niveispirillum sp. SYP-B3756 TaxID=2662178 RepID=UPI001291FB06|nr:maleylacetoacetate isomerase [Niveispirillum sp. SYP-B3756]MQP65695.1 maleylacetoacetate isomerase [Niveispirillum sp. SYP-B3756]